MSRIDFDVGAFIQSHGLNVNERVQAYIDSTVLKLCKPKVPHETGALIRSGDQLTEVGSGTVQYGTDYGHRHYYNTGGVDKNGKRYGPSTFNGAPERGSYWFERMKNEGGKEEIGQGAAALAGGRYEP